MLALSKKLSRRALFDQVSWPIAASLPSGVAPRRRRRVVSLRWVVKWNICWRVSAVLTGRCRWREPIADSITSPKIGSLPPKSPPMWRLTMRTLECAIFSVDATAFCAVSSNCEAQWMVTRPSFQYASVACGFIWAWM